MSRVSLCFRLIGLLLLAGLSGCAMTTVRPKPGRFDRGVRYYRPKPYLLVQPDTFQGDSKLPCFVKITLEYLPDFSEEYSIHVWAGLGTNKTNIALSNGWNLTSLNVEVDQKVPETISALGSLASAIPKGFLAPDSRPPLCPEFRVEAYAVPIGYYEAVLARDRKGCKHLVGWRYVGFAPFGGCATEAAGDSEESELYGLVVDGNRMVFRRLSDVATTNVAKMTPCAAADAPVKPASPRE